MRAKLVGRFLMLYFFALGFDRFWCDIFHLTHRDYSYYFNSLVVAAVIMHFDYKRKKEEQQKQTDQ